MIILQMAGFPGSGKSTISKEIARRINAIVIDKDILKSSMLENGLSNEISSKLAYDVMFDLGKFYLEQGRSIVLDTPCYYDEIIVKGMKLSKTYNAEYKYLHCFVEDYEIINERIKLRKNMISQITEYSLKGFENAKARAEDVKPSKGYMKVDSSNLDKINYELILEHLKEGDTFLNKNSIG